jgi:hypothetical protein
MEKIVTHPLYIRCKKVIESCQTLQQFEVALKYWSLAQRITEPNLLICDIDDWREHAEIWENMLKGI